MLVFIDILNMYHLSLNLSTEQQTSISDINMN